MWFKKNCLVEEESSAQRIFLPNLIIEMNVTHRVKVKIVQFKSTYTRQDDSAFLWKYLGLSWFVCISISVSLEFECPVSDRITWTIVDATAALNCIIITFMVLSRLTSWRLSVLYGADALLYKITSHGVTEYVQG